jgi:hypothetical protein
VETSFRPLPQRRITELRGYVSWGIVLFRAVLFVLAVAAVAWLLAALHRLLVPASLRHDIWWIVPTGLLAASLYAVAGRWTGGRELRKRIREDIAGGVAAVHRVVAVEAIEVGEREDEGPAYFIRTADGRTILFAGQYLYTYKRKGFPWTEFEIVEAPRSQRFFELARVGEPLKPSASRPPFTWEEFKRYKANAGEYVILDVDFGALKRGASP